MKVHLWDWEHQSKIPRWLYPVENIKHDSATKCGYLRENTTTNISEVTCKLCLRQIAKETPTATN